MRKSLLAVFAVFVMLAIAIPAMSCCGEDTENADEWHFKGQIMHDDTLKTSPNTVEIKLEDSTRSIIGEFKDKLDANGWFDVKLNDGKTMSAGSIYYVTFYEFGYSIASTPSELIQVSEGTYKFTLKTEQISGTTVTITSPGHYITMGKSTSTLNGKVVSSSGDKAPLNGVKIMLIDPETKQTVKTEFSQSDGTFAFKDLSVGKYKLVAESKGFQQYNYPDEIEIFPTIEKNITIEMTPSEGIDVSHWMTIIGGSLALIVLAAVVGHIIKSRRKRA